MFNVSEPIVMPQVILHPIKNCLLGAVLKQQQHSNPLVTTLPNYYSKSHENLRSFTMTL